MDAAADVVDAVIGNRLGDLQFDGAAAGRAHTAAGVAVRARMDRVVAGMAQWAAVARETGAALRAGAEMYADAELRAEATLR
jgi:hypothetical protein